MKNPSSIQLHDVLPLANGDYVISIDGENSFGGMASEWYKYNPKNGNIKENDKDVDNYTTNEVNMEWDINSWDLNKINKALKEYFDN